MPKGVARLIRLIVNPVSGGGRGEALLPEVCRGLKRLGYETDVVTTKKKGDAREAAANGSGDDVSVFVVFGGDGTINEVINGLNGSPAPICIVPVGVANCLAKEFSQSAEPDAVIRRIKSMQTRMLDSFTANGRRGLLFAGAGLDGEVGRKVCEARKGHLRVMSYVLPLLRTMITYHFPGFRVDMDGETVEEKATFVEVSNVSTYGGPIRLVPGAQADDGMLDVLIMNTWRRTRIAGYLVQSCLAKGIHGRNVRLLRGREITLTSEGRVPYQVDGDFAGYLPLYVRVLPRSVCVLVDPPGKEDLS